jgi:hypothetical protein
MLRGGARWSGATIHCRLLRDGGRADFIEGAGSSFAGVCVSSGSRFVGAGSPFAGICVSGGSRFVEDKWMGEASTRVFWADWVECWVGVEAQRGAEQGGEVGSPGSSSWGDSWVGAGSGFGSDLVSDPILDMGFSCDFGSDLLDRLPTTSFLGQSMMPHLELGAVTAMLGEEASDFTLESPAHTSIKPDYAGDSHFKSESHFGLTKSQKWLLASLREAV